MLTLTRQAMLLWRLHNRANEGRGRAEARADESRTRRAAARREDEVSRRRDREERAPAEGDDGNAAIIERAVDPPPAQISVKDEQLAQATWIGDGAAVQRLLREGASPNAKVGKDPAIVIAAHRGHLKILRLLREAGANIEAKNGSGATAIMWACYTGRTDCVRYLIHAGCDLNVADQTDGSTALIFASRWGHRDSVRLLIEADADTDPTDSSGKSALQLATAFGHTAIIELLRLKRRVCRSRQRLAFARGAAGSKPPLSPIEMLPYDLLDLIGEQIPLLSIEVAARVQKQRG